MHKRIISLLLILALLPACLAVPVMAEEDYQFWYDLLDYGYPLYRDSNVISLYGSDTSFFFDNPVGGVLNNVDILFQTDCTSLEIRTSINDLRVVSLGNGLFRAFGTLNVNTDSLARFWIYNYDGSYVELLSVKVSPFSFSSTPVSFYGYVYDYSYSPIKETSFSGDGSSPITSVSISPNAGMEDFIGFVSRIYIPYWRAHDYISLNISLFSSSFASLKVEMDGVSVPYEINTVESTDVLGTSLYLLDILIDVRNLDRTSDSYILVDVSGMVNPSFTGNFTVRSCLGFVSVPSPSLWTHWFTNLQGWLSSGFSSVTSALSTLGTNIGNYISAQTSSITSGLSTLGTNIGNFISNQTTAIGSAIVSHQQALIDAEKAQHEADRQLWNTISSNVGTWISNQTSAITNSLSTINTSITTFRTNVGTWFTNQTNSITSSISAWGQSLKDSIDALPEKIAEELKALIVPADGAIESMATKSEALVSDRFGGVFEGAQIVDNWAGQLHSQAATQILTIPVVNMNILGSNFPIGGWDVDLIPDGFEIIFESVKIIIDILATAAFVNGIKYRLERTLEG